MARRRTRTGSRRRTRSHRRRSSGSPGWLWMLFGLAVGLSVAAAIYINDRKPGQVRSAVPAPRPAPRSEPAPASPPASDERRFDFYEILPSFEVVIPEEDLEARPDVAPEPVEASGSYVLQAGSFSKFADADAVKANIARVAGIKSRIQKVTVDDKTYHRVRIGPVQDLEALNRMRSQLREAGIEIMVIRVAE